MRISPDARYYIKLMLCLAVGTVATVMAAVFVAFLLVSPAKAQSAPPCAPESQFRKMLLERYQEVPVGAGIATGGRQAIILYASPEGKTFTIVIVHADGKTCMIAAGDNLDIGDFPMAGEEI